MWLVVGTGYRIVTNIRKWLHGLAGIRNWLRVVTVIRKWLPGLADIRNWLRIVTGIRNWLQGCDYYCTLTVDLRLVYTGYRIVTGIRKWLLGLLVLEIGYGLWLVLQAGYPCCGCYYTLINTLWLVLDTGYRIVTDIRNWLPGLAGIRNWLRSATGIIYWLQVVTAILHWLTGCDLF